MQRYEQHRCVLERLFRSCTYTPTFRIKLTSCERRPFSVQYDSLPSLPSLERQFAKKAKESLKRPPPKPKLLDRSTLARSPKNASMRQIASPTPKPIEPPLPLYEQVKKERESMEEMRKIVVLGRIMHQCLRKNLKVLNARKNR